ncbi:MAG: ABC transporter ATP-binding protein [Bacteroidota bacterium]
MTELQRDHIIALENLAIGYHKDSALLSGVNLSVRPGEMVALIGRNGTGKSTLLKSMIGLIPMLEGGCYLDSAPLSSYDLRRRAQKVSYVSSQVSQLPSISVLELVTLGRMPHTRWMGKLGEHDRSMVKQALEEVQMGSFLDRKLDQLSDGERQRAMIARAFVQDTPLMVLDEPTAFLDIPNKYELIRLLSGFRSGGKSIIYSTHDLETAMMCADKLWVIHGGKILEGAPEDLGISGVFTTLFHTTGIMFDEDSRRFKYAESPKGSIRLTGEPAEALAWTGSALERLGFDVKDDADSLIQVSKSKQGYVWVLSHNEQTHSFENIYSLARFLNKDK